MKKHLNPLLFLVLFTLLGFVIRFYLLGKAPAGLYLDEAAQGYNAYSILKTGRDEFGKYFPVVFRSFNDFKTPLYIYLVAPLIPLFGLTPFTVRFPSFIFSIATLPLLYFLIKLILPNKKQSTPLALISVLILALSPWHTLFGRTNFECNVALFLFLLGCFFYYKSLVRPSRLIFAAFFFALALPAYHSQRILVPLMLIILLIRHWRILLSPSHRWYLCLSILIGSLITLPTLSIINTPGFLARASVLNIFSSVYQQHSGSLSWYHGPFNQLVNAPWFLVTKEFFSLYFSYFSPRNLFFLGDYGPRSSFPQLATFFTWGFPFYLYGLYRLIKDQTLKELRFFTLALFLIAPLPAAVTRDPFSTIRALPLVVPFSILISLGLISFFKMLSHKCQKITLFLLVLTIFYSLLNLYSSVIVLNEYLRAAHWDYGWEKVVERLNQLDQRLPVVIDGVRNEPYSQILFFTKLDPAQYQKDNFEVTEKEYYTNLSRNLTKKIGRITVRGISWKPDLSIEQYLVGDYLAISQDQITKNHLTLIDEIKYPDGTVAFRITKTNPSKTK